MALSEEKNMVNIGRFAAAVGLHGEIRVFLYAEDSKNLHVGTVLRTDYIDRLASYVVEKDENLQFIVTSVRWQRGKPVIKLKNVTDRTMAEKLTGLELYIDEKDLVKLPEGHFYYKDLIGLTVYDRINKKKIGVVSNIIDNTSQELFEVQRRGEKPILIPNVDAFVKKISIENGIIEVELIEGFLD